MLKKLHILLIALPLLVAACSSAPKRDKPDTALSITTFNVENLFDTQHDEGKKDYAFLPVSFKKGNFVIEAACEKENSNYRKDECLNQNWNEKTLKLKMKRLADTVFAVEKKGPDILLLQEVENLRVLQQWNDEYLQEAGYQTEVLLEGPDVRGIDNALLSRLPLAGTPVLHKTVSTSRDILEVPLKLPTGETLSVLVFHFPSQANPVEERRAAIEALNKILQQKGPNSLVIAGGDSNITAKEEALYGLHSKILGSTWKVSHLIGCKECQGTESYRDVWSYFDILLFSPNLLDGSSNYQIATDSISVVDSGKYQLQRNGTPARFKPTSSVGVSDHLPVYAEILPKKTAPSED